MNSLPKSYTLSLYTSMNEHDIVDLNCDFNSSSRVLKYFTQRGISPIPSLFSMNSILPFELSPNIEQGQNQLLGLNSSFYHLLSFTKRRYQHHYYQV